LCRREVEWRSEDKKLDGLQTVEKRLEQLVSDLSYLNHAHFLIINRTGELDKTVEALEAIYEECMTVRSING
jgi:guanylate kinase